MTLPVPFLILGKKVFPAILIYFRSLCIWRFPRQELMNASVRASPSHLLLREIPQLSEEARALVVRQVLAASTLCQAPVRRPERGRYQRVGVRNPMDR